MSVLEGKGFPDNSSTLTTVDAAPITEEDSDYSLPDPIGHHIGLFGTVTLIVGRIVGSGIFASPGPLFANVNSVGMALILWTVTGLISAIGGTAILKTLIS
jgi:hypothetical protein